MGPRALIACLALAAGIAVGTLGTATPTRFHASDPALDAIWKASVRTAEDTVSRPVDLDPRGCHIHLPLVLLDSPKRDRCPYIGDQAVDGLTLLVAGDATHVIADMLAWYASVQNPDGSIPSSPLGNSELNLVDYDAYWIESLYDYVLYTGDLALLHRLQPNLVALLDRFYPRHVDSQGLLVAWDGGLDYAFIDRGGPVVAYYNAQYVRALRMAAELAVWAGDPDRARVWTDRADRIAVRFGQAFWDSSAGAFRDATAGPDVHPEDGNAFAVLAGLASPAQATSALDYISRTMSRPWGYTMVDSHAWVRAGWPGGPEVVYPFISYYEVLARYAAGEGGSALELIRREWGWMLDHGPVTMWETIGPEGKAPASEIPSWDHGWSSGAAPALTNHVLGVQPTSPGFATFTVDPSPGYLTSAEGQVWTPHGPIHVTWTIVNGAPSVTVDAPPGTVWTNAPWRLLASGGEAGSG